MSIFLVQFIQKNHPSVPGWRQDGDLVSIPFADIRRSESGYFPGIRVQYCQLDTHFGFVLGAVKMNLRKKVVFPLVLIVMAALLVSACSAAPLAISRLSAVAAPQTQSTATPAPEAVAVPSGSLGLLDSYQGTLESIYQKVNPSVVNIQVVEAASPTTNPLGGLSSQPQQALGSGFVWDTQGHIVTNNHVAGTAQKIEVTFADGTTVPAKLVGADPSSDLAVVQVDVSADMLHPVTMADSTQVKVGQVSIAIGNPFGLQGTMTTGIISGLERTLPADTTQSGTTYTIPDIIQTDAAINPGNSGGVLVDIQGQVLGVTAAIESSTNSNAGIGFVIPSEIVKKVVPALIKDGKYVHTYLGISGTDLTPDLAKAMDLPSTQRGALVMEITAGGPAEKAGLIASGKSVTINGLDGKVGGDVITAVDGTPIKKMDDLIAYLTAQTEVGQKLTLTVLRGGKETSVIVTLEARPTASTTRTAAAPQPSNGAIWMGIRAMDLNPALNEAAGLKSDQMGVLLVQVEAGSPADQAGLVGGTKTVTVNGQPFMVGGDVIVSIDGKTIDNVQALKEVILSHQPGDKIQVTVLRDGRETEVTVHLAEQN